MIRQSMTQWIGHRPGRGLFLVISGIVLASSGLFSQPTMAQEANSRVVVGLGQLQNEIAGLRGILANTVASLEEVKTAAANKAELTGPYQKFTANLTALDQQTAKLREHGTATRARAKEHWAAWQTELTSMQNAKLREKAQSRYTATAKEFQKIQDRVDAAKEVLAPLIADLKDVNVYLNADLSQEAVSSLSGNIWKMGQMQRKADTRLVDVNDQIDRVIKKMPKA